MHTKRTRRAAIGATCLVIVALAMGWFVGQYIPGTPKSPEMKIFPDMFSGNGDAINNVVDIEFGQAASLEAIVQGRGFYWDLERTAHRIAPTSPAHDENDQELIEHLKSSGSWEFELPSCELRVDEARAVSASAFAELYPDFADREITVDDCTMMLVTVSATNVSDEIIQGFPGLYPTGGLPSLKLWTDWTDDLAKTLYQKDGTIAVKTGPVEAVAISYENVDKSYTASNETAPLSDGTLGSGAAVNSQAFVAINDPVIIDDSYSADVLSEYIYIEPGKTQTLVLPFSIPNKALDASGDIRNLDLSKFSIQTADFSSGITYRFWLK